MKKIIALVLSVVLCFAMLPSVMAAGATATISAVFDSELDALVVSGNLLTEKGNVSLVLKIENSLGSVVYTDAIVVPYNKEANNNYEFKYDAIKLNPAYPSGDYTVTVSGKWLSGNAVTTYNHVGPDRQHAALSALAGAIASQNAQSLASAIIANGVDLGINASLFAALKDDGVSAFNTNMFAKTYTVPAGYIATSDIATLKAQIANVRADYKSAISIAQYNDLSTKDEAAAWVTENAASFNTDIPGTAENEVDLFSYVNRVKAEEAFVQRTSAHPVITTLDTIRTTLYADAILTIIESHHYSEYKLILQKYPSMFGIDTAKLAQVSETEKATAYETVKGSYVLLTDVGTAFNAILDGYINANAGAGSNAGSSSGSSSGGSAGYKPQTPVVAPINPEISESAKEETKVPDFTDISSVPWATEAINYLASKGIASGKADGVFAPNDLITRAEFIKLLVVATNTELADSESSSFTDVSADAWYCPYIAAAEKSELILGNADNMFMPNESITRQDMATILYRAYGLEGYTNGNLTFADAGEISNYAKEAIAFLAGKKIINGMGDNTFAPLSNATRAQVAVIIYNMIK